jgi:uncharacterized membrane protein YccC
MAHAVPDWLAEVVRPKKAPVPWPAMAHAVVAIWVPLAAGIAAGDRSLALLPAMGGLVSVMIDQPGPYRARFTRVAVATVFGGAAGLVIGSLIHGRGWVAVVALVAVAGASSIMARLGSIGSVTGLQLLMYCALSAGPVGALRPWWHTALGFVAGGAWALLLLVPGWLRSPRSPERGLVAAVYRSLAAGLRAIGTPEATASRLALTAALNAAYDALLSVRAASDGRARPATHLLAILNASHPMTEAVTALRIAGEKPPPWVIATIDRLADLIGDGPQGGQLPLVPPSWSPSAGAAALRESMVGLTRVISGNWSPPDAPAAPRSAGDRARAWVDDAWGQLAGGPVAWAFTVRLMACMTVATVLSEVLPIQRSYWVPLTVAVILKPDYGSVFARALQRAIGTVAGAVLGAVILVVVPFGPWLLIPFGILAALLPYGKARNFGLSATFLTPLVVLLIDLLSPADWKLAGDRAIDTVLASVVVLVIGYALWPASWHAHLPRKLAATLRVICDYMDESLVAAWAAGPGDSAPGSAASGSGGPGSTGRADTGRADTGRADAGPGAGRPAGGRPGRRAAGWQPPWRSRLRRRSSRALSDLRAEYQRTMSEPAAVSRRASALWPGVVALEELMDAVTATAVAISRGARAPAPGPVRQLTGELRAIAEAMDAGLALPPTSRALPDDEALEPVTAAVRSVLGVLTPAGRRPPQRQPEPA